jgi:multidrug resistance protein MdtO
MGMGMGMGIGNYSIALTLLVNTVLLPAEPARQLADEIHRQLIEVQERLDACAGKAHSLTHITSLDVQRGALVLQKMLRFTSMRDSGHPHDQVRLVACILTVSRLYRAASRLPALAPAGLLPSLTLLRMECSAFDAATAAALPYRMQQTMEPVAFGAVQEMQSALHAFSETQAQPTEAGSAGVVRPMHVADAFTNPVYMRFSLKTLLAVLGCYVFYNAVQWEGIHTIMLTCVIIALPSVGASNQKAVLRAAGALAGSALALFVVVFVMSHLEGIVGLLCVSLPVVALGAWIAAGSERIGYAGIQIVFTFALALLESFGPTSDLTEIRDRLLGILLGIGISTFIQMSIWPERESDDLRLHLADMLQAIVELMREPADGRPADARRQAAAWTKLGECEQMLAHVALEPAWEDGEHEHLMTRARTVVMQGREIMLASHAMDDETSGVSDEALIEVMKLKLLAAARIDRYIEDLSRNAASARHPELLSLHAFDSSSPALLSAVRNFVWQVAGLPDWQADEISPSGLRESHEHE